MKVWVVTKSDDVDSGYVIMGVHQCEDFAYTQANELMSIGEWSEPLKYEHEVSKIVEFHRGSEIISIEEVEVKY